MERCWRRTKNLTVQRAFDIVWYVDMMRHAGNTVTVEYWERTLFGAEAAT